MITRVLYPPSYGPNKCTLVTTYEKGEKGEDPNVVSLSPEELTNKLGIDPLKIQQMHDELFLAVRPRTAIAQMKDRMKKALEAGLVTQQQYDDWLKDEPKLDEDNNLIDEYRGDDPEHDLRVAERQLRTPCRNCGGQ